ncbi:MAG: FAD-dependent oxidoreductase [Clostridiales bacterium]|nr:FAD-dependent oxidoreductase [Clostridiales bacterium]
MKKYNLIVVGGGLAGVAAAVSAAREGLSVLLIEKFGCLGGAMTNSLVYPFMPYSTKSGKLLSDGIFTEMLERKKKYSDSSWESYKCVFDDMVTEAGVDVLFHSTVFEANTEHRLIKSVSVATKSGIMEFEADFFIDCSGDGELIAMTNCDYQLGRESDGLSQPMTTCFRVCGVDVELFNSERTMLQERYEKYQEENKIINPREDILVFCGYGKGVLHFNTTRVVKHNPVDPVEVSKAEMLARKQVMEMMDFLKENSKAFSDATLISVASHIGVRESRKLKGVHILTADELFNFVDFEDTIALGNYPIDIHNPAGKGTTIIHIEDNKYYRIPYRSLLPKEYDNMLVAGRCLSATHEAQSSVRIMPICACLGEAAGVAAAIAYKTNKNAHTVDITDLRSKLIENGAAL